MIAQDLDIRVSVAAPYQEGTLPTFRRVLDGSTQKRELLRVKIKKLQEPWTLSCCMVVDILSDSFNEVGQTAFLKLFGWRFAAQQRSDQGIGPWTEQSTSECTKFVLSGEADMSLHQLERPEDQWGHYQETDEDWDAGRL
ncbi:hypothetical protein B0H66DRAFT_550893 [Apodospora peruviana]|uniref:Uncharacterized protein n=1 Tax=Apodospora peruviana TaxID=516989 RepID=A0AAE0MBF7_9PEZI|nr:hypothetical protein B0H66DRAFT_550893 [Apodospora peruviana]